MTFSLILIYGAISFLLASVAYRLVKLLKCDNLYYQSPLIKDADQSSVVVYVMMMIWLCLVAPLTEELFFRLILFKIFLACHVPVVAVVLITSILFALAHCSKWPQFPLPQLIAGVMMGMAFLAGGFWASVAVHATHNFIVGAIIVLRRLYQVLK